VKTKRKHCCALIRRGLRNYRGYCIHGTHLRGWVIKSYEGGVFKTTKTLRAMKAYIDRIEARPTQGDEKLP
jgi:hypothetical protein